MAITNHNMEDREFLDEIARGHRKACELLEFCESFLDVWNEKERKFLSAWGAVGQATGRWGQDIGNVTYATAWHHMLQEADTTRWHVCRRITARVASGNVIEILFGVIYLYDRNIQTLPEFAELARERHLNCYEDVYASTFLLIQRNVENFRWVAQYRFALETYVWGWRHLLFDARSEWGAIFAQYNINATWNPKEILFAFEVMRMGHAVDDLELFRQNPLPPPLAPVSPRAWREYLTHCGVQPNRR